MNFYEILKTKKLGRGSPDYWTQLFAEHVGGKGEWTVTTLTGVLPLTFRSNGTALINYKICGTAESAGVQTENLYNKDAKDTENGYVEAFYLTPSNGILSDNSFVVSEYIPVDPNTDYYLSKVVTYGTSTGLCFYDENKTYISGIRLCAGGVLTTNITTPDNCSYIRTTIQASQSTQEESMITKGSLPPETYVPFGYKIPLTITNGTESKTADIYIGDSKLEENDLIVFSEQKIFTNTVTTVSNGTEDWKYYGVYGGHNAFYYDYGRTIQKDLFILFCNKYTVTDDASVPGTKNNTIRYQFIRSRWNINRIYIFDDRFNNIADFKENLERLYLANDPLIIIKQGENTIEITPPVPFPAIESFSGENTLDSTETLGEITIKGQIKPQS